MAGRFYMHDEAVLQLRPLVPILFNDSLRRKTPPLEMPSYTESADHLAYFFPKCTQREIIHVIVMIVRYKKVIDGRQIRCRVDVRAFKRFHGSRDRKSTRLN